MVRVEAGWSLTAASLNLFVLSLRLADMEKDLNLYRNGRH